MDSNHSNDERDDNKPRNNVLDWSQYITHKRDKLFKQFNPNLDQNENGLNQLFSGVCIYVNGVTNPSEAQLKTLVINSGGMYLNHFDPQRTTHTIAENLPFAKTKNLKANQIVVTPQWITESIAAKHLLPFEEYLTIKRDHNLRQYLNKPIGVTDQLVEDIPDEDINQMFNSNETIGHKNDELRAEPQMTTTFEIIVSEDEDSNIGFNQNNYIPGSFSQIDPQFLDSLPLSLRDDILKDLNIHSKSIKNGNNKIDAKRKDRMQSNGSNKKLAKELIKNDNLEAMRCEVTNCLNSGRDLNISSDEQTFGGLLTSVMTANICGKTDTRDVIQLIEEWVTTEEELIDEDIAYMTKYFCDLIDEKKFNHLIQTFSKLFECVEKRDEMVWKQSFNDIRNTIITENKTNCNQKFEEIDNLPHFQLN